MSRPAVAELAIEVAEHAVRHNVAVGPPVARELLAEIERLTFQVQETEARLTTVRGDLAVAHVDARQA